MNGFTWLQDRYCLQNSTNLDNFESRSFEGKTLDGRHVYILKDQFNLLPKEIQAAFKKINHMKFQEFQHLTWRIQAKTNNKENYTQLQKIINIDVLKNLMPYLSVTTKQIFCFSSHHLKEAVGEISLKDICEHAALEGNLEILKWARKNGAPWNVWTCAYAAGHGRLEILMWARKNGAPWDERTCAWAAAYGHLDVLKWAREHKAPWDVQACAWAAADGHLDVLKWARNNGAPWDEWTCSYAAGNGHLSLLQWARANGAPWNVLTCTYAAKKDHLKVLKWAREHKTPWNIDLIWSAASQKVKKWLEVNP